MLPKKHKPNPSPKYHGHIYRTPETCSCDKYSDRSCMVCEGGLAICTVCHLMEGALTTDCPGVSASANSEAVYQGFLDFRKGEGWVPKKNPCAHNREVMHRYDNFKRLIRERQQDEAH